MPPQQHWHLQQVACHQADDPGCANRSRSRAILGKRYINSSFRAPQLYKRGHLYSTDWFTLSQELNGLGSNSSLNRQGGDSVGAAGASAAFLPGFIGQRSSHVPIKHLEVGVMNLTASGSSTPLSTDMMRPIDTNSSPDYSGLCPMSHGVKFDV